MLSLGQFFYDIEHQDKKLLISEMDLLVFNVQWERIRSMPFHALFPLHDDSLGSRLGASSSASLSG
jgi:hypothetical protein